MAQAGEDRYYKNLQLQQLKQVVSRILQHSEMAM